MSGGLIAATVSTAIAMALACFTVWVTAPLRRLEFDKLREELDDCLRDRRDLRHRYGLLQDAVVALLPLDKRIALLERLDEAIPAEAA